MANDLEIRLKADRAFVKYLCDVTGKSASALAAGADMASTTLNRFVGKRVKPGSTLKDSTIEKIAKRWGLDYITLISHRKNLEEAIRESRSLPEVGRSEKPRAGMKEAPPNYTGAERDPLMDQIMGATYDVWFNSAHKNEVSFERLPSVVRLLYSRAKLEAKIPATADIRKRASDVLAGMAIERGAKK